MLDPNPVQVRNSNRLVRISVYACGRAGLSVTVCPPRHPYPRQGQRPGAPARFPPRALDPARRQGLRRSPLDVNGTIDRRPAVIARCTGGRCRRRGPLRPRRRRGGRRRGGGHNVAGTATCDDGIVIDLSDLRAVWVDPANRTARVQGGPWATSTARRRSTVWRPPAHRESHGVAGLTLGGGTAGHAQARPRVDNLLGANVVTAEGEMLGCPGRASRPVLGAAGRRRKLRRGHLVRLPTPPRRTRRLGRADSLDATDTDKVLRFYRVRPRRPRRAGHGGSVRTAPPLPSFPRICTGVRL